MKIGIITYNKPHYKTQELIYGLYSRGYKNITLIIKKFLNFKNKKFKNYFNHRPNEFIGCTPFEISKYYNFKVRDLENKNCYKNLDIVLIGGSSIINQNKIEKNLILNSHSGLIPETRGLDSFKWAILKKRKVGGTLHFIDKTVDKGNIIFHQITPSYKSDTLELLSKRHYRQEINMLINFENNLNNSKTMNLPECEPTKRMSYNYEKQLHKKFQLWKKFYVK